MSQFWSLDDDDESGRAGESSHMGASLAALSPSSRSQSTSRDNAQTSSSDNFHALIDEQDLPEDLIDGSNGIRLKEAPVTQLQRAWISERACPELLAWKGNAIDDVCSQIEEQMVSHIMIKILSTMT